METKSNLFKNSQFLPLKGTVYVVIDTESRNLQGVFKTRKAAGNLQSAMDRGGRRRRN
jgi:hypothetical protein